MTPHLATPCRAGQRRIRRGLADFADLFVVIPGWVRQNPLRRANKPKDQRPREDFQNAQTHHHAGGTGCHRDRVAGRGQRTAEDHHRHTNITAQHRAYAGNRRQGTRPIQKSRPRGRHRFARRRRESLPRPACRQYRSRSHARRADHHRHLEWRRRQGAVGEPAEVRSLDDRARRHQDDGGSQRQAHRHPGTRRLCRSAQPQRAARGQDRSQGCQFRQHRQRRRAGVGRQPGRHRDPACRAGDVREVEGAGLAPDCPHVGVAA
jgi:hypothetical protein